MVLLRDERKVIREQRTRSSEAEQLLLMRPEHQPEVEQHQRANPGAQADHRQRTLQQQRIDQPAALPEHEHAGYPDHHRGIAEDAVLTFHPRFQIAVQRGGVDAVLQWHEAWVLDEVGIVVADPDQREQQVRIAGQQIEDRHLHVQFTSQKRSSK